MDDDFNSVIDFKKRLRQLNHYVTDYVNPQDLLNQVDDQLSRLLQDELSAQPAVELEDIGSDDDHRHDELNRNFQRNGSTLPPYLEDLKKTVAKKYSMKNAYEEGPASRLVVARDSQLDRDVAIKVLTDRSWEQMFRTSIRAAVQVTDHPNILTIYGAWLDADPPHYVRQYVLGLSLEDLLEEKMRQRAAFGTDLVQDVLVSIGCCLDYAHDRHVDSFSVKPSNIIVHELYSEHQTIYLCPSTNDEELLRSSEGRDALGNDVAYMPDEYRRKMPPRSPDQHRADQYRLGLIGYEMLVGRSRFLKIAEDVGALAANPLIVDSWPAIRSERQDCPRYLADAIDKMVRVPSGQRFAAVREAVAAVENRNPDVEIARESFRRIVLTSEEDAARFFHEFYREFFRRAPNAKHFFIGHGDLENMSLREVSAEWRGQFHKLTEAIVLLLIYASVPDRDEPTILTRIAEQHRERLGVPSSLYEPFGEALVETAMQLDKGWRCEPRDLGMAWSAAIEPGIEYMRQFSGRD